MRTFLFGLGALLLSSSCIGQKEEERFEKVHQFKHSLKPPFLLYAQDEIRFWKTHGMTLVSKDYIRVVPSVTDRRGSVWNKFPVEYRDWEITVTIKISGRSVVGADGMGLWYTQELDTESDDVYGGPDHWEGLAVFLDTFNNDGVGYESTVLGVLNDGNKKYDHRNDGESQKFGDCNQVLRNTMKPIKIRVTYFKKKISVMVDTSTEGFFDACFEKEDVTLPANGYFGVSAATGGLADDHDLYSFEVLRLSDEVHEYKETEEHKQNQEHFEEIQKEFEEEQAEYNKAHHEEIIIEEDDELEGMNKEQVELVNKAHRQQFAMSDILEKSFDNIKAEIEDTKSDNSQKLLLKLNQLELSLKNNKRSGGDEAKAIEPDLSALNRQIDTIVEKLKGLEGTVNKKLNIKAEDSKQEQGDTKEEEEEEVIILEDWGTLFGLTFTTVFSVCFLELLLVIAYLIYIKKKADSSKKFI